MTDHHDDPIDRRLSNAADRLAASFSDRDTESALHDLRSGKVRAELRATNGHPQWLPVAAAILLVVAGIAAVSAVLRTGENAPSSATFPPQATTPSSDTITATTAPAEVTPPATTQAMTPSTPPTTSAAPVDTTLAPTEPPMIEPSGVYITVTGDDSSIVDVRKGPSGVESFDLGCPADASCFVQSARVMGNTVWVAMTQSGSSDTPVRSRVVSVGLPSGEVVEHLSIESEAAIRETGLGADGQLYAYLAGPALDSRELVVVNDGDATVVESGVSGFRLSDDGRYLAVSFSDPSRGETASFEVTDLVDGTTNRFDTGYVNAGPAAWSPDGRHLIVNEQWEGQTAWVIDPWGGTGEPLATVPEFLDGACFINDQVIAHRTWNVGYGQGDAQPGTIRLTSIETGDTVGEIGDDLFGDAFRCHPDGSASYLRRPVIDVEISPGFSQPEPDGDAPTELVHLDADGTATVIATGDIRMV